MPDHQSQHPKPLGDTERWDYFDEEISRANTGVFKRPVALVDRNTGGVLAEYVSLASAFDELQAVPDAVKARAFLGWAPEKKK